ncbi:uncharacterized protein [Dendrobates tinctorius]|uniref:uncharacterized protein n=1 Tax=Dendrobates tinctorius TaxID=92724 RepID=UPI003CCA6552
MDSLVKKIQDSQTSKFNRDSKDYLSKRVYLWRQNTIQPSSRKASSALSISSMSGRSDLSSTSSVSASNHEMARLRDHTFHPYKRNPVPSGHDNKVINFSGCLLSAADLRLLSRGLSFSPASGFDLFDTIKDLHIFARSLLFKRYFHSNNMQSLFPTEEEQAALTILEELASGNENDGGKIPPSIRPKSKKFPPLSSCATIDMFVRVVTEEFYNIPRFVINDNITHEERWCDSPPFAGLVPVSQPSVTWQVPPRNAWFRGSPYFTSSSRYIGQTFKRINVVRFKYIGAKEDLPQRRYVVRELLCGQMGFVLNEIRAVSHLQDRQGYEVSFKLMSDLDRFCANFLKFRDTEGWKKFVLVPISRPDTVTVNITFWNEAVPPQNIEVWLWRHCDLVSGLTKVRDEDGIWTIGWRVLVKLRQYDNITAHLPNSFFIGEEKGRCYYPGHPRKCFKCGGKGHLANTCTVVKCSLCGAIGHVAADCRDFRCNLCGKMGHSHRDCPDAWHNVYRVFPDEAVMAGAEAQEDEDVVAGAEAQEDENVVVGVKEEEDLMSREMLTSSDAYQESTHVTPEKQGTEGAEGNIEVIPQVQQPQVVPLQHHCLYLMTGALIIIIKGRKRTRPPKSLRQNMTLVRVLVRRSGVLQV